VGRDEEMEEKTREAVGLKKFSIISPVLNGQVGSNIEYFREISSKPIDMPHFGLRKYSVKTLMSWLYDYNCSGLEGLILGRRSDKGKRRKITPELSEEIISQRKSNPNVPISVLYEKMVAEGIINPTEISRPTIYTG